ncbi:YceI family protein [Aequorivita lipolytica]|uniref:YceI family protein n=1 Tax=Aequorivita lipolytica TaxID=153267 RepID=A0A5C6YQ28_9FLAO|nr:YceI family protein [Aequorivita lipolytica]TXD69135.1 YceI family protein [Aequorivita lipolytica]SRX51286.1 Protein YceI [Aequorivita lipolytica]
MENTKTTWNIDPTHSEINFKVKHLMISTVTGSFEKFDGKVETSKEDFKNADFSFAAEIDSVNTNNKDRDDHLKSDEFFGAEKNPELRFKSKSFDGEKMVGDLTIKDVTKEVILNTEYNGTAVDPYGQTKAGFEIEGEINRKDFGLTWNAITEAGSVVVSDKVKLIASLQFIKQ